jgi:hypothetical protein
MAMELPRSSLRLRMVDPHSPVGFAFQDSSIELQMEDEYIKCCDCNKEPTAGKLRATAFASFGPGGYVDSSLSMFI